MHRHVHSKVTYRLRVQQFIVPQVGKGGINVNVIDQVIAHHTNSTLRMYRHAYSKETHQLSAPVHSTATGKGGKNVIVSNQVIAPHTKFSPKNVQTCPFKGNLHTESAPGHSTASGERRKQCDCY